MSDKTPLIAGNPSAPLCYQAEYGIQPPPAYDYGVQRQQQQSNVTVIVNQARPVERRVVAVDYKPPNYVTLSIITMLCFCWILGLIGLILALQVDSAWEKGDHDGARCLSSAARLLSIVGIVSGITLYVVLVVVPASVTVTAPSDTDS